MIPTDAIRKTKAWIKTSSWHLVDTSIIIILWSLHNLFEASFDLFRYLLLGDQLKHWELHPLVSYTNIGTTGIMMKCEYAPVGSKGYLQIMSCDLGLIKNKYIKNVGGTLALYSLIRIMSGLLARMTLLCILTPDHPVWAGLCSHFQYFQY